MQKKPSLNIWTILFWIIITFILLFYHFRGLSVHDGGYIVNSAQKILNGQTIYKDFDFVYTPGSVLITTVIFKLFGSSIFVERIFAFLISLFTIYKVKKLLELLHSPSSIFYLQSSIFLFLFWAPTHINFISPVVLSITTSITTVYFFAKYLKNKNANELLLAGLTTGLTILWKQNFGIMMFLTGIIFFINNKKTLNKKNLLFYSGGFILPLLTLAVYLLITNSFSAFINDFWFYTVQNIILNQKLTTPFLIGSSIFIKLLKLVFYTIPFWVSTITVLFIPKNKRKYLFICFWVILFYLVSIRPETDFIHLSPVLAITGILLSLLPSTLRVARLGIFIFSIVLIILGFWTSLFFGYYRWEKPLAENTVWNNNPRINIWTDSRWKNMSQKLKTTLDKYSAENDYLFINANTPLLYFISNRKNPTRFDFIIPYVLTSPLQQEIINELRKKNVRMVVTGKTDPFDTQVAGFISNNYRPVETIDQYIIWVKN